MKARVLSLIGLVLMLNSVSVYAEQNVNDAASVSTTSQVGAPALTAALAQPVVSVDVNFSGAPVTLFAVSNAEEADLVAYVVALVGPRRPYAMTQLQDTGLRKRLEFVSAPAVLSVAAEEELPEIATTDALVRAGIHDRYAAKVGPDDVEDPDLDAFRTAFLELQRKAGLFSTTYGGLTRIGGGLIRADIYLPAAAPPGDYDVRIFMFRDGEVVAEAKAPLTLIRQGAESTLWNMAHHYPVIYGILAVCIGVAVGGIGAATGKRD